MITFQLFSARLNSSIRLGTKNVTNLLIAAQTVLDEMTEDLIASDTETAEAKRREWGSLLLEATRAEFSAIGVVADHRYYASRTIIHDNSKAPAWSDRTYSPCTKPGHRSPCTRMRDGTLLYDVFGQDFTLVAFADAPEVDVQAIKTEASRIKFPLKVLSLGPEEDRIRKIYETSMVLVRPDQAVCWRGRTLPVGGARYVLDVVRGVMQSQPNEAQG